MVPGTIKGEAIQILKSETGNSFVLDEDALSRILLDARVQSCKVMLLSVAGAYRKGKSFLLNFFLRYLNSLDESGVAKEDWMGDKTSSLDGFKWKGGSDRTTTGILMWSHPFFIENLDGEKICVLLMDTQGAFDSMSTVKESATVFALSVMLSSVQVYNITSNIQEDDLQHLELFTEYGRMALETYEGKPFQSLLFLVRDWQYPYQYEYGLEGGKKLLNSRLEVHKNQHEELQKLRRNLHSCFEDISCFLMAHPGLTVATSFDFSGKLQDVEAMFQSNVQQLIEHLLHPSRIVPKQVNQCPLRASELIHYFKAYLKMFQGESLPELKSVLEATAEANNLAAVARAKDFYNKKMAMVCGGDKAYIKPENLIEEHEKHFASAMKMFVGTKKMGGEGFSSKYELQLSEQLTAMLQEFEKNNIAKKEAFSLTTPFFYVATAVVFYMVSGLSAILGIILAVQCFNIALLTNLICLFVWSFSRYTGRFTSLANFLDSVAKKGFQLLQKRQLHVDTSKLVSKAAAVYADVKKAS